MQKYFVFIVFIMASLLQAQSWEETAYDLMETPLYEDTFTPEQQVPDYYSIVDGELELEQAPEICLEEFGQPCSHYCTANVTLVSDYRFRGISQTMRRPAIQGGFDYINTSGIYFGTWASNVDGSCRYFNNASLKLDLYAGYTGTFSSCLAPEFRYNLGLIYYYFPGGQAYFPYRSQYNMAEFYVELAYKWISVKYWQTITNYLGIDDDRPPANWAHRFFDDSRGSSRGSSYIEANLTFNLYDEIPDWLCHAKEGSLTVILHGGHQTVKHYEHLSYSDWMVTVKHGFPCFDVFLSYVGTNADHEYFDIPDRLYYSKGRHLGGQALLFGITKVF